MKLNHLGSQQKSSFQRASLYPETKWTSYRGTGILLTPSMVYFNCFIITIKTIQYKKLNQYNTNCSSIKQFMTSK